MKIYKSSQIYPGEQCSGGRAIAFDDSKVAEFFKKDEEISRAVDAGAVLMDCSDAILMPGLVNAHCHLDMSGLGELPVYPGTFLGWVKEFWDRWNSRLETMSAEEAVSTALQEAWAESQSYGTLRVGDIARLGAAGTNLARNHGIAGISFEEILGLPQDQEKAQLEKIQQWCEASSQSATATLLSSLEVHAPYTCGPALYQRCAKASKDHQRVVCTHLAETHDELAFVAEAAGPMREFYKMMGIDDQIDYAGYGHGQHSVQWMKDALSEGQYLLAHCNYLSAEHMDILAETGTSVAYCPRASAYYQHDDHPYRDLMAAGVNVCLGTDSALAVSTLSMIDEMRLLRKRDGVDVETLLRMCTVNGMKGLGLNPEDAMLKPGSRCGLIAVRRADGQAWGTQGLEELLSGEMAYTVECLEKIG